MEEIKVGIIIVTYNISVELFLLQIAAIRKFCKDDFDILIVDNSSDLEAAEHIKYHASQQGVEYIKTFAGGKGSSDSHSFAANFAYQKVRDLYSYFHFLDHDCLPVKDYSIIEILNGGHVAAGIGQEKVKKYLWPGNFLLNGDTVDKDIIDFSTNLEFGLDTGGNLYKIIERYGEESFIFFDESYHQNPFFVDKQYGYYSAINKGMFYHCANGSNWAGANRHEERINAFINVVKEKTGL